MILATKAKMPRFKKRDRVKIKPREEILKSLDINHKLDGCLFTDQMWEYCGKTYNVLKVINSLFDEHKKRSFKLCFPFYLLDTLYCNGQYTDSTNKCDHGCLLIWHEGWLDFDTRGEEGRDVPIASP